MDIVGNIAGYFEEVETTEAYDGYWYAVKDIIVIYSLPKRFTKHIEKSKEK